MTQITIPQIKSTAFTMLAIFLLAPLFTAWQLQMMGEFHVTTRAGLWDFCVHAATSSFWLSVGWLFVRSPFAGKITELLTAAHSVAPDGTKTDKSAKLIITEPSPPVLSVTPEPTPVQTVPPQVQAKSIPTKSPQSKPKTK